MTPSERTIQAAQGYFELEMFREALRELDTLAPREQMEADVLELRVLILMKGRQWRKAVRICDSLCAVAPEASMGYIQMAFCLHELGQTRKARQVLLGGPETLRQEATFHYNLACYECVLGNFEVAKDHLEESITLNPKLREFARQDPDLTPLFDS